MKGLIIKDLYMAGKYCRTNFIIMLIFLAFSLWQRDSLFIAFYPIMLSAIIPTNLLAHDERCLWLQYSETLPYSRAQIVSGKYIVGFFIQIAFLILTGIVHATAMSIDGTFDIASFGIFMMLLLTVSMISSSINLPFMFKSGVEKGRLAYYVMIGIVTGGSVLFSGLLTEEIQQEIDLYGSLPIVCLISIAIFAFSWFLSIAFYRKREL